MALLHFLGGTMPILFMVLVVVELGWAAQCDKRSGPAGTVKCIQYNYGYQWATCLTDAYIKQKSNQRHQCYDPTATYCWYDCMREKNNKVSGTVTSDCSCTVAPNPKTLAPSRSQLPPECYSPPADSCGWYSNCLERKYPCEATSNEYVIRYAEHFCKLQHETFAKFTLIAQKWVDEVRKCLLVALVPLLRPWMNPTCEQIRERAYSSHTPCYLDTAVTDKVCDLDCSDYFKIFWSIKGSFTKVDTLWESLKGLWNIGYECRWSANIKKCYRELKDGPVRVITLKVVRFLPSRPSPDPLPESDAQSLFADGVGSAIASALRWNSDVMDWLAYTGRVEDPENLEIVVSLADKKALGVVITSTPSIDLNKTIKDFASAVQQGTLSLKVEGQNVWVKTLASCFDKACNNMQTLAVSDKTPHLKTCASAEIPRGKVVMRGTIVVFIMMMNKLFY
ncbi:uncharacterized protein LOC111331142 [Stylophora pistillata]|uniref:uncharacterized protein LOC111331142 n=1 Tax=Stylophora pistillata TaxID=50429 RepID=UPI000C039532|nr:uncharacterized protein LOC111331142 [Stylophora pistillata]